MANEEQLAILKQGVEVWNKWREDNEDTTIDLTQADLSATNLLGAYLAEAYLSEANFRDADLRYAIFNRSKIKQTDFSGADLQLAGFSRADLSGSKFINANLRATNLTDACFDYADLSGVDLLRANLSNAKFRFANLSRANLAASILVGADLRGSKFFGASLIGANLSFSSLVEADLSKADLSDCILTWANVDNAIISDSRVYGINVWNLQGELKEQKGLIITSPSESEITIDNIEVAQFIYLILNNKKVRSVLDTLTSKAVLILGRFAVPERKHILDTLKNKLREYGLLPIVFDFDRPSDKDFTETIKTLAGLCYFVIADVTNPKSSPLELQATVPDYQIPFVPIIQEGESPFAMMVDLQKKYNWVLNTVSYDSKETLMKALKPLIIDPAMKKRQELRIIKAQEPEIISAKDYLDKGMK